MPRDDISATVMESPHGLEALFDERLMPGEQHKLRKLPCQDDGSN